MKPEFPEWVNDNIKDEGLKKELMETWARMARLKKYTHEELKVFEEKGIEGQVCTCPVIIMNSMTLECVRCGNIQSQYAKKYARRNKNVS